MRTFPIAPAVLFSAVVAVVAACGGEGGTSSEASNEPAVRDSAGIRIVETASDGLEVWTTAPEPILSIGALDGSEAETLYQVNGVTRTPSGSWVVSNGGTEEVRIFGPNGGFVGSVGREGEGPGEFSALSRTWVVGDDSIVAWDNRRRVMSAFDIEGELGTTFGFDDLDDRRVTPIDRLADGSWLVRQTVTYSTGGNGQGSMRREDVMFAVASPAGADAQVLVTLGGSALWTVESADFVSVRSLPFGQGSDVVAGGDRIYGGVTERAEIRVWNATGQEIARWRLGVEPEVVTESDWMAERDTEMALFGDDPALVDWRRQTVEFYDEAPMPEVAPVWRELVSAVDGSVWMRRFQPSSRADEPSRWWVFDASGAVTREVILPSRFELHWADGDQVAGIETDEFDVEYVRVYDVAPSG